MVHTTLSDTTELGKADVLDVLIVGAGFSGLYQLDRLRDLGFSVKVVEAAPELGGVWYWNCYPGARSDTNGPIYQFSREDLWKEWDYDELYPSWKGIGDYFAYVDSKLDLSRNIWFNTRVASATYDSALCEWRVGFEGGESVRAKFLMLCTGFGSKPYIPEIEGLESFAGECHHTALWPQDGLDLTGKRVAILGTGASGVQVTQEASQVSSEVYVLQRTPNLALPMRQRPLDDAAKSELKEGYPSRFAMRSSVFAGFDMDFLPQNVMDLTEEERQEAFEALWAKGGFHPWLGNYQDVLADERANRAMYDFWRAKVVARISDPEVAALLAPEEPPHPFGVKRPSLEQNYYDVFNQSNVHLVDVKSNPVQRITAEGVQLADGRLIDVDVIVLATGFDANSGGITAIDIRGVDGVSLKEKWSAGVDSYLGAATHGFPNLLFVYGPQSPAGFCNGPTCAELQGEEIVQFLEHLRTQGMAQFDVLESAEQQWTSHTNELFEGSMFTQADSWYYGANVPGKPRQMLNYSGGVPTYLAKWRELAATDYASAFELQ